VCRAGNLPSEWRWFCLPAGCAVVAWPLKIVRWGLLIAFGWCTAWWVAGLLWVGVHLADVLLPIPHHAFLRGIRKRLASAETKPGPNQVAFSVLLAVVVSVEAAGGFASGE